MRLANLATATHSAVTGLTPKKGSGGGSSSQNSGRTVESTVVFGPYKGATGRPAFIVRAKKRGGYPGRLGNLLNVGVYRVAGSRYILTLYEDDTDKLNGTVSTAGITGIGATTVEAIVYKINNTNLNNWIEAEMINNYTNIEFTSAGGVAAANAIPMTGGRG